MADVLGGTGAVVVGEGAVNLLLPSEFPLEVDDAGGDLDKRLVRGVDLDRERAEVLVARARAGRDDVGRADEPAARPYHFDCWADEPAARPYH